LLSAGADCWGIKQFELEFKTVTADQDSEIPWMNETSGVCRRLRRVKRKDQGQYGENSIAIHCFLPSSGVSKRFWCQILLISNAQEESKLAQPFGNG
jgi:hypothetical protein